MPQLIVANCTKQTHDFVYRDPESKQVRKTMIPPGGQAYVYKHDDYNIMLDKVIKPAMGYGMVPVSEIYETHGFIGLCFSIDTPIQVDKIMETDQHNEDVQNTMADEIRKQTAVAIHQSEINKELPLNSLSTEVVEQAKPGDYSKKFAKGVRIRTT